jgi:hypothetical protein
MVDGIDDTPEVLTLLGGRQQQEQRRFLPDGPSDPESGAELLAADRPVDCDDIGLSASEEADEERISHTFAHRSKGAFLAAYKETGLIAVAARIVGVARRTHYDWLENDPAYREAFELARMEAADNLMDEAVERAIHGIDEPIFYRGKPVLDKQGRPVSIKRYSDRLLIHLLKILKPHMYGEC